MLRVGVIGIGNCGNQIARLAMEEADCGVICVNTSENDLATLPDSIREEFAYLIGDSEGSGKNRDEAKKFLKGEITKIVAADKFVEFMDTKDIVIVASSTGGGTGSGMAPMFSSIIRQGFKNKDGSEKCIILLGVLPKLDEGYSTQVNTKDYLRELYEVLDDQTYMLYDNDRYKDRYAADCLTLVNRAIIEDIKVLQCRYNNPTPYDSIDEKDMKMIISTPGRIVISSLLDVKEKDLDSLTIEDKLIDQLKTNAHAEIQRDGVVARTGLISNLSEKLNGAFDTHLNKVRNFAGEPVEEFLHTVINDTRELPNNVSLILTGLTEIQDRMDKIDDRIQEIEKKQAEQEAARKRVNNASSEDIERMNEKRNYRQKSTEGASISLKDTFAKFGV